MTEVLEILYVDDCEVTVELLKMNMLRYSGDKCVSMEIATTVAEADALFSVDKHVAALIDWNLPDGKGTDVAQKLRCMNPTLPIIFLSAIFTSEQCQTAQEYRPVLCLSKDHSREFVDKILNHITAR